LKILHIGNLVNNSYKMVKFLRLRGIDADLLLFPDQIGTNNDPAWEDEELKNQYPDWIRIMAPYSRRVRLADSIESIIKRYRMVRGYDIIHAQCTSPITVQFLGKPFIAHSLGSDLRELAHQKSLQGMLMRRAYRKSAVMLYHSPDQIECVKRFKFRHAHFFPNPYDTDRYAPQRAELEFQGYDLILFHPTRLDWTYTGSDRSSTKGNDRFIRAFRQFTKKYPKAMLIMIESGVDVTATKRLLDDLDLTKNVKFFPRYTKSELIRFLNAVDVVVDQFDVGSLGGMALEAMSTGKPVITYVKEDCASLCYPELPPVLNCHTEDEIYQRLLEAMDAKRRQGIGEAAREWILKYHHWEKVIDKLIFHYETILGRKTAH